MKEFLRPHSGDPAEYLQVDRARYPTVQAYIEHIRQEVPYFWRLRLPSIARFVEPTDSVLGQDPNMSVAKAFTKGATIGLFLARRFLVPSVLEEMEKIPILEDEVTTNQVRQAMIDGSNIVEVSERGKALESELSFIIDEWAPEITPAVSHQTFVTRGFGLVMYLVHEACAIVGRQEIEQQLITGTDARWDEALKQLLDSHPGE